MADKRLGVLSEVHRRGDLPVGTGDGMCAMDLRAVTGSANSGLPIELCSLYVHRAP